MPILIVAALAYLAIAWTFDYWPFDGDLLPLSKYESTEMNVYFYYPGNDGREVYLGRVLGASSCGNVADAFAREAGVSSANWGYICCTIRKGSQCYEKVR